VKRLLALIVLAVLPSVVPAQTEFSQENATALLRRLVTEIGPRPMGSPAEQRALEFACDRLKDAGCDTAYIMRMEITGSVNTTSGIAIGIHRGTSGRAILIGGHIDSAEPEVPGADDDGSGTAVVLECARVLSAKKTHSTLIFCTFGGEERGLEGSRYFTAHYHPLDSIDLMLQADMANGTPVLYIDPDSHGASAPPWLFKSAVTEFYRLGYSGLVYPHHFFSVDYALTDGGAGSDHESFLDRGIPAVDFTSDVDAPIHTPRDNMENFHPDGLKRTGDLILTLAAKYDSGVPGRWVGRNFFYIAGRTPLVLPLWSIRLFCWAAAMLAVTTIAVLRRRRIHRSAPGRVRWSGSRLFLSAFIVVAAGWFSSDMVGLIKGIRHPWLSNPNPYLLLTAMVSALAGWVVMRGMRSERYSPDPYVYFWRSAIWLLFCLTVLGIFRTELMVGPAIALAFLSLAVLIPNAFIKTILVLLSPWWMLRLVYSEWSGLLFRTFGEINTTTTGAWFAANGAILLAITIWTFPFFFGAAAAVCSMHSRQRWLRLVRSPFAGAMAVLVVLVLGYRLASLPSYDGRWRRDISCDETRTLPARSNEVKVYSSEYLEGIRISGRGIDTAIRSKIVSFSEKPAEGFDTSWVQVERMMEGHAIGNTTECAGIIRISALFRPYHVSLTWKRSGRTIAGFESPLKHRTLPDWSRRIEFDSFPDSVLEIPVAFEAEDSVRETIEVTFDRQAFPLQITGSELDVVNRTRYLIDTLYEGIDRTERAEMRTGSGGKTAGHERPGI
jgi:hypothetical protein